MSHFFNIENFFQNRVTIGDLASSLCLYGGGAFLYVGFCVAPEAKSFYSHLKEGNKYMNYSNESSR